MSAPSSGSAPRPTHLRQAALGLALALSLVLVVPAAQAQPPGPPNPTPNLQARVAALETLVAAQGAQIAALITENGAQDARLAALETETLAQDGRIAALEADSALLGSVLGVDPAGDLVVSGANLYVVSGAGSTNAPVNGKGNLIVGYDEADGTDSKLGSHNLVIGPFHTYTSYGGVVAGWNNHVSAPAASVTGGQSNRALGFYSSVSGGVLNQALGQRSSVSGGQQNVAVATDSSVTGGVFNTASGFLSSVSGGRNNTASGTFSSVSGGFNCVRAFQDGWGAGVSLGVLGVFPVGVTSPVFACP